MTMDRRQNGRLYGLDNLRCFLMLCVVLGHFLESSGDVGSPGAVSGVYLVLYTFHMPALLFISGWFARWDVKRLLCDILWPYLLCQLVHNILKAVQTGQVRQLLQFWRPWWLLWYLPVLAYCMLLTPLLARIPLRLGPAAVAAACGVSLAAGYWPALGYTLALGRFCCFVPCFTAGHFAARAQAAGRLPLWGHGIGRRTVAGLPLAAGVGLGCWALLGSGAVTPAMLYGAEGYAAAGGSALLRAATLLLAGGWTVLLLYLVPQKPLPGLTALGQDTLGVYILHGALAQAMKAAGLGGGWPAWQRILTACVAAALTMAAFAAPPAAAWLRRLLTGRWLWTALAGLRARCARAVDRA